MKKYLISIPFVIALSVLTVYIIGGLKNKNIEKLMARGDFSGAEAACSDLEGEAKIKCYRALATTHYNEDRYEKAAVLYAKAGAHLNVIGSYYLGDMIAEAEAYCHAQSGETKKKCAHHLAGKFYFNGNYKKALQFYQISKDKNMTAYIEQKVPVFQLMEELDKVVQFKKDHEVRIKLLGFKETLKDYIYMKKFLDWRIESNTETAKLAAAFSKKAVRELEDDAAPVFIEKIEINTSRGWTPGQITAISFYHVKMASLIRMIKHLHNMAAFRLFFTRNSVVFVESPTKNDREKTIPKDLNYEEAFKKALEHVGIFFKTLADSKEGNDPQWLDDYRHDLGIDMRVVDYVFNMMDNLEIRIVDIKRRSTRFKKAGQDKKRSAKRADELVQEFLSISNKVLHAIGKGKYNEANQLLTDGYNEIKGKLALVKPN